MYQKVQKTYDQKQPIFSPSDVHVNMIRYAGIRRMKQAMVELSHKEWNQPSKAYLYYVLVRDSLHINFITHNVHDSLLDNYSTHEVRCICVKALRLIFSNILNRHTQYIAHEGGLSMMIFCIVGQGNEGIMGLSKTHRIGTKCLHNVQIMILRGCTEGHRPIYQKLLFSMM